MINGQFSEFFLHLSLFKNILSTKLYFLKYSQYQPFAGPCIDFDTHTLVNSHGYDFKDNEIKYTLNGSFENNIIPPQSILLTGEQFSNISQFLQKNIDPVTSDCRWRN